MNASSNRPRVIPVDFGFGLVTYLWGRDWELPALIENCQKTGFRSVELRTTHKHGVEPSLSAAERKEVAARFGDSEVNLAGIGSDERFDTPDPEKLRASIEATREFIRLSHDVGGSGVKVKPDSFHKEVPREKTIEQIGKALNELGEYGMGFGQQIRLEVHGQCSPLPVIAQIMKIADHDNVAVCWNSNNEDVAGKGIQKNFELVEQRLGHTVHVRELDDPQAKGDKYPYEKLFELLALARFGGWVLLEARTEPSDRIDAMRQQKQLFDSLVQKVEAKQLKRGLDGDG